MGLAIVVIGCCYWGVWLRPNHMWIPLHAPVVGWLRKMYQSTVILNSSSHHWCRSRKMDSWFLTDSLVNWKAWLVSRKICHDRATREIAVYRLYIYLSSLNLALLGVLLTWTIFERVDWRWRPMNHEWWVDLSSAETYLHLLNSNRSKNKEMGYIIQTSFPTVGGSVL